MGKLMLEEVKKFAAEAHEGQRRKYTGEPYIVHPRDVVRTLRVLHPKSTLPMIYAAWLHDTVEDTEATIEQIHTRFGEDVSNLVGWLTDVSKPEDGNREFRKSIDRQHTMLAPYEAQIVKCADLIDNSQSILKYDPNFAVVYLREKQLLLDVMRKEVQQTFIWKTARNFIHI